jgi:hypothetical protein
MSYSARRKYPISYYRWKSGYYLRHRLNKPNSGQSWLRQEVEMILAHKIKDVTLSILLGRSVQAIQVRRSKIKSGLIRR